MRVLLLAALLIFPFLASAQITRTKSLDFQINGTLYGQDYVGECTFFLHRERWRCEIRDDPNSRGPSFQLTPSGPIQILQLSPTLIVQVGYGPSSGSVIMTIDPRGASTVRISDSRGMPTAFALTRGKVRVIREGRSR